MIEKEFAENVIRRVRSDLIFEQPFFGYIALKLIIKDVTDENWLATFATDKRYLYYNRKFINLFINNGIVNMNYIKYIFAHEILHCVLDLIPSDKRREDRDEDIWWRASDYSINSLLNDYEIGKMPISINIDTITNEKTIRTGLYNKKYKGWYAEKIYEELIKNPHECNYGFGDHIDFSKHGVSSEEIEQNCKQMSNTILDAKQHAGDKIPNEIKIIIDKFINPKINWRNLLHLQIQNTVNYDYTFMKPSRKSWHMGCILPGIYKDQTIEICCAIDRSRSITIEMLNDFISELYNIMKTFNNFNIKVWSFDTKICAFFEYDSGNFEEILNFPFNKGGGGTSYECNWKFMYDNNIKPKQFIMFTDGMPGDGWGDPYYCNTLFIIHTNINKEAPFGISIPYDF